jgi:acetoin:2,6-dichlorophenolindophenol oxidoreductase subunit beta
MQPPTYLDSLRNALHALLESCKEVVVMGEDVVDPYGGAFKVTRGLSSRFPERVLATPISEAALIGVATGMALRGLRPVVEIMFGDFLLLAADQLINSAAKFPLMYRDRAQVPLVLRTPMGGGRGYGPTHSQSLEKLFLGVPGLRVVSPSLAHDPGGVLQHCALETSQPVLFIEHKSLYTRRLHQDGVTRARLPDEQANPPTVVVENFSLGSSPDVVVLAYGGMSAAVLDIMEELAHDEIRIRALFPSLISAPLGTELAAAEVAVGCPVLVVEEGSAGFTWGSEIAASLQECGLRSLGAVRRLTSRDAVVPAALELEQEVLMNASKLREAVLATLR